MKYGEVKRTETKKKKKNCFCFCVWYKLNKSWSVKKKKQKKKPEIYRWAIWFLQLQKAVTNSDQTLADVTLKSAAIPTDNDRWKNMHTFFFSMNYHLYFCIIVLLFLSFNFINTILQFNKFNKQLKIGRNKKRRRRRQN